MMLHKITLQMRAVRLANGKARKAHFTQGGELPTPLARTHIKRFQCPRM